MTSGTRKFVFFVLLVGLSYVAYAYMIKPANQDFIEKREKMQQKAAKLSELEEATVAAKDLTKRLAQLEEAVEFFESKLPPKSQIDKMLNDVTIIAQKHGLNQKKIGTAKTKNNSGYIELPLKMELSGNFNSYYSFLLELEQLDRITKIRELSLMKTSKFEGHAKAIFVMSIFFQDTGV